jgi:hypothetical protein
MLLAGAVCCGRHTSSVACMLCIIGMLPVGVVFGCNPVASCMCARYASILRGR